MGIRNVVALCLGLAAVTLAAPAWASPLNLEPGLPDISASFCTTTFDAGTGTLTVTGYPSGSDYDGAAPPDYAIGGNFFYSISVVLNAQGVPQSGSIRIDGTVAEKGFVSGTLLTGTLAQFGFPSTGGEVFEFIFDVTGGDLAAGGIGHKAGAIVNAGDTGFGGSFGASFASSEMAGESDNFAVPEPCTMLLLLTGAAVVARRRGLKM